MVKFQLLLYQLFSVVVAVAESCGEEIAALLRWRKSAQQRDGLPREEVVERLAALPDDCNDDLERAARTELSRDSDFQEGSLAVLLDALARRRAGGEEALLQAALTHPRTQLKEDYASALEDRGLQEDAEAKLIGLLEGDATEQRDDLAVTIRALHARRARQAAPAVARHLSAGDRTVRGLAMAFLYDLDDGSASGQQLVDLLVRESDSDIVEQAVGAVDLWDWLPAIPILDRIALDESHPTSLRNEAGAVATRLRTL